jgi:RNA polymerase sigma-70 factor, ECF subfamily
VVEWPHHRCGPVDAADLGTSKFEAFRNRFVVRRLTKLFNLVLRRKKIRRLARRSRKKTTITQDQWLIEAHGLSEENTNGLYTRPRMTPVGATRPTLGTPTRGMPEWDVDRTSSTLLDEVRDWQDHPAWNAFFDRYDPLLRFWCRRSGLRGDETDELCQRIWIELMGRMRTFRYDPSRGFRRWLWRLFRCRAIDLTRHRASMRTPTFDEVLFEQPLLAFSLRPTAGGEPDDDREAESARLFCLAEMAQRAVQARVDASTWRAFELIAIEDWPVGEVARELGKKYTAVYNGYKRVDKLLRQGGERCLASQMKCP